MIEFPSSVLCSVSRNGKKTVEMLFAEGHRSLLGFEGSLGQRFFLREVLIVQSYKRDIVRPNVKKHQFFLQECILRKLVWQVEEKSQEVERRDRELEV